MSYIKKKQWGNSKINNFVETIILHEIPLASPY
uniref:Uncharacterized protein n=1 Tax=Arundo donax TaxID=35708 RepID=A0A0A9FRI4_ARUDO